MRGSINKSENFSAICQQVRNHSEFRWQIEAKNSLLSASSSESSKNLRISEEFIELNLPAKTITLELFKPFMKQILCTFMTDLFKKFHIGLT